MRRNKFGILFTLLIILGIFIGCLKQKPDVPPNKRGTNPDIAANTTIYQLKKKYDGLKINNNIIITGVVVMSDKSGNYFKKIVIQDLTGGIEIPLNQSYLYTDFPIGRRIFVKCQGLFIGKKNGLLQMGTQPDANGYVAPIPPPMIKQYIYPGAFPSFVGIDTLTIPQLLAPKNPLKRINTLVAIKNVEFVDSDAHRFFAQPPDQSSATTRLIKDCNGAVIPLQTSAYANFQALKTPTKKGLLVALYSSFRGQSQLYIRDTNDLHFYKSRCNRHPKIGSLLTIRELKEFYHGYSHTMNSYKISGIVISDKAYKNTPAKQIILQGSNDDAGINILFPTPPGFDLGDSLLINIQSATLFNHYDVLTLKNIAPSQIQVKGTAKTIQPKIATISQIKTNPKSFVSRLLKIKNIYWLYHPATLNGYSGNLTFSDGTDTMSHFCEQACTFKNYPISNAYVSSITGYIFVRNNVPYIKMRNPDFPEKDLKE